MRLEADEMVPLRATIVAMTTTVAEVMSRMVLVDSDLRRWMMVGFILFSVECLMFRVV